MPALNLRPAALLATLILAGCGQDETELVPRPAPEPALAEAAMVSTPDPLATEVALTMLRRGGNAVDAAVAASFVLALVEAPETGPGGGGFLLHHSADDDRVRFYDGRETAPAGAEADRFTLFGRSVPLYPAVPTGRAVGVPGLVALLGRAHAEHGRLPWAELLAPAIDFARQGVPMPERLRQQIEADPSLRLFADMRRYFRRQAGEERPRLVNPVLADSLTRLAGEGAGAFYQPPLSTAIIDRAGATRLWPSDLTQDDFDDYRALERDPVCGHYRQWRICSAAPPSSGGIAVLQILGMLEAFDLGARAPDDPLAWHLVLEATRLAFADRQRYLGDPDFVDIPVDDLLDADYLARRAALISPERAREAVVPGVPPEQAVAAAPVTAEAPREGTSHLSIVDAAGNAVALTSSNEKPFGARMMAGGFVLNNQLTDFTFDPEADFGPHPNAPGPGKRPRSSMAPVLVFDANDDLVLVLGSRGGSRIIGYVVKTLVGVLDWGLPLEAAVTRPNLVHGGDGVEIEAGTRAAAWAGRLEALGHAVEITDLTSGVHGIERTAEGWRGAADPRLGGMARGFDEARP